MAATTTKGFPYPNSTDTVDVPADIFNLANAIESKTTTTATINTIPYRETGGAVTVGTPTSSLHAVTKAYVDTVSVPLTTTGDMLYASASGTPATSQRLPIGGNGSLLLVNSGIPSWLGIGTNGYVLTVSAGAPVWSAVTNGPGNGTGVGYTQTSGTLNVNTATTIDTVAISGFIGIEYLLNMRQGTKSRVSTIRVITDGTSTVSSSEYGILEVGGSMTGVNVVASLSSTNSILQITVTDAATTNVTWRLSKVAQ